MRMTATPCSARRSHEVEHLLGLGDAERGGRLVEDDDARLLQHGAGDRDGLALAAGEATTPSAAPTSRCAPTATAACRRPPSPCGPRRRCRRESPRGRGTCSARCRGCRTARGPGRRPRCRGAAASRGVCRSRVRAVDEHLALVVGLHAGEALDEGGLAGAVVADQGGDLAGVDLEVDALEDADRAERLLHADQFDDRRPCSCRV